MRVELRKDLNAVVARMVRDKVDRLANDVAREARRRAPAAHVWLNVDDGRVRPAHVDADGQAIPGNLRFKLKKQVYIRGAGRGHKGPGHYKLAQNAYDLAREPRDESLPDDQLANCRCAMVEVPDMIAKKITVERAVVQGTRARGVVQVKFNRIVESHTGTSGDSPNRFLSEALDAVAARLRN
jgi:hypothetical protein